jgi:hypothetical protein
MLSERIIKRLGYDKEPPFISDKVEETVKADKGDAVQS